jgi:hypothetical protein
MNLPIRQLAVSVYQRSPSGKGIQRFFSQFDFDEYSRKKSSEPTLASTPLRWIATFSKSSVKGG